MTPHELRERTLRFLDEARQLARILAASIRTSRRRDTDDDEHRRQRRKRR